MSGSFRDGTMLRGARSPSGRLFARAQRKSRSMPALTYRTTLLLLLAAAGCAPAAAEDGQTPPKPAAKPRPWLDVTGDSIVGFGLLRVVPPKGGGAFRVHYKETQIEYSAGDDYQLFVLPGDA